jgi:hypothetical protein
MAPRRIADTSPHYGYIATPHGQVGVAHLTRTWCLDNQVFTGKFDPLRFSRYLRLALPYRKWCRFVVCPDVVGDADATDRQFAHWRDLVRAHRYPAAYAAQDGCTEVPDCDALFIGGSTEWKMGNAAIALIETAKARGVWVHVGRVNTPGRLTACRVLGVDSVDGTTIAIAEKNTIKVNAWMNQGIIL